MIEQKYGTLAIFQTTEYFNEETQTIEEDVDFEEVVHECTEEEFPYQRYFSGRRESRSLNSEYIHRTR